MITEQTKKAFQTLSLFTNKPRWFLRLCRGLILLLLQQGTSLYLMISGTLFLYANAPLATLGNLLFNSTMLSAFLATLGMLGVTIGFIAGAAIFRLIFEIAHLFYPMKLRLAPFHLTSSLIGTILGALAALKIGAYVTSHFSLHPALLLNSLSIVTGSNILLAVPVISALAFALLGIFHPSVKDYLKISASKFFSLFTSFSFKLALIFSLYYFFEAGFASILLACSVSATFIIINSLFDIATQKHSTKMSQKLCYDYQDKSISLASILNLRADDPLVEELLPNQAEISSLCKTPIFMTTMFLFDYRNEQNYDNYLNQFADYNFFGDFIKLGANPLECLKRTKEEKAAQVLLPYYDDEEEKKEIVSVVDLKSYTLKWQAAKILAKREDLITKDIPVDLIEFIKQVKAVI